MKEGEPDPNATPATLQEELDLTERRRIEEALRLIAQRGELAQETGQRVRRGGRIVTCGVTGGAKAEINLQQLYWNHISLLGSTMGAQEDYRKSWIAPAAASARAVNATPNAPKRLSVGRNHRKTRPLGAASSPTTRSSSATR